MYKTKMVPKKSISACWTLVHLLWELTPKEGVRSFVVLVVNFARSTGASDVHMFVVITYMIGLHMVCRRHW